MKNQAGQKKVSLNPVWVLLAGIKLWRIKFWRIVWLTLVIAIPASVIRVVQLDGVNDVSILATLAGLFLTLTLTYAFLHEQELKKSRFTQLYVLASSRFLPFLFDTILLSLLSLVIFLGVFVIILALSTQIPQALALLGIVIIVTTLYFLVRFSIASILVVQNDITAISAMRLSWQLTHKNLWRTSFAWLVILFSIVIFSGLIFTIVDIASGYNTNQMVLVALNAVILTLILPIFIGYGVEITKRLEQ